MSSPILVTGATGTVGSRVLERLTAQGHHVRAASRRVPQVPGGRFESVYFDFTEPLSYPGAFTDVDTMFLVRPPALARLSDLQPALHSAISHGVRHIVFLSVQGAEKVPVLPHARIERWLQAHAPRWTFLRPAYFHQNLTTVHGPALRDHSILVVPAGDGRTALVDAGDVAEVAAQVLVDPTRYQGRSYTLTGTEAPTWTEIAHTLTTVLGRPILYERPGLLAYLTHRGRQMGLPTPLVAATAALYTLTRLGLAHQLTRDVTRLLNRDPITLAQFADHESATFLPALP